MNMQDTQSEREKELEQAVRDALELLESEERFSLLDAKSVLRRVLGGAK